ncbi:MAG: hypothetical protein ABGZ23_13805 [Fuerstiella sp.]
MKHICISAIALCLLSMESVSAASMFGYYPTYSTGYYGWGSGYAYARPNYGYANYGYRNWGYPSSGYRNCGYASYGGCNSGCGTCGTAVSYGGCNSGCGTCGTVVRYGGCGVSNCCTNACYTNPGCGTETSGSPKTDSESGSTNRTFDPVDDEKPGRGYDDFSGDDTEPSGDFSAPPSSGRDWTKPRNPTGDESSDDTSSAPPSLFNPDGSLRTTEEEFPPLKEFDDAQNRGVNKPPMSNPVDEDEADDSSDDEPTAEQGNTGLGTEIDVKDFLSPDTSVDRASVSRSFRSSHVDVLSMHRLAGDSRNAVTSRTLVSSSRRQQRPARWISVPLPNGRIRL